MNAISRVLNGHFAAPVVRFATFLALAASGASAHAVTYVLPSALGTAPFVGCTLSGRDITCTGSVNLGNNSITSSASYNVLLNNNFTAGSGFIGSASYPINITAIGRIEINSSSVYGDLSSFSSSNEAIEINNNVTVHGDLFAILGEVDIDNNSNINGNVTADQIDIKNSSNINGACVSRPPVPRGCNYGGNWPITQTIFADSITRTTALFRGFVNPNSSPVSSVTFSYGTSAAYGSTVSGVPSTIRSSNSVFYIEASIGGLSCGTTYHFQINARNANASASGGNSTFETEPCITPSVTTNAATSIGSNSATLNSTVASNGASTAVTFEIGTAAGVYTTTGLVATGSPVLTTGNPSLVRTGLTCNTTYYFRAKGVSTAGTTFGAGSSFRTAACTGEFDAYEASLTAPSVAASKIFTRVASANGLCVIGGACNLKIGAFNAGTRVLSTSFTGPVRIELVDATSGVCLNHPLIASWQASQTLSASGETTLNLPAVNAAYPHARVRISFPATGIPTQQNCSSDGFAIRPRNFNVAAQSVATGSRSLSGTTNTSTTVQKAGRPFRVILTALNAEGNTVSNYTGTPSLLLAPCTGSACTTSLGTVANAVGPFTAGAYTNATATYSNVGAFRANYSDAAFSAIDASDSQPALTTEISGFMDIGRFIPDHFAVAMTQGCSAGATPFTYSGQPFAMTVTARNASGATVTNHSTSLGLSKDVNLAPQGALAGALSFATIPSTAFVAGAVTYTPTQGPSYAYTNKLTAPSTLSIRASDADGVTSDPAVGGIEGSLSLRSGQLKVFASSGSDRATMLVPLALQYWGGASWVSNGDDACTTLTAANIALTGATNAAATHTASNPVLSAGAGHVSVVASSTSGSPSGHVNIAVNLGTSGTDQSCNTLHGGAGTSRPWLRSLNGNCSASYDRDPAALLYFGVFTNESKGQVDIREVR